MPDAAPTAWANGPCGAVLQIARADITSALLVHTPLPAPADLAPGQALIQVERVALTANTVTYAAAGTSFRYWAFFPAPEDAGRWGVVPSWGYATVIASAADGLDAGERLWGYWPLASHVVVQVDRLTAHGFVDAAPHRAHGPSAYYNAVTRVRADPGHDPADEDLACLFKPLFTTSFLIDDVLAEADFFGARQVIVSSASSKTALGLAHCLALRAGVTVAGLTSPAQQPRLAPLGLYAPLLGYADLTELDPAVASVFVDFAGAAATTAAVHRHFGDALTHSAIVGMTQWQHSDTVAGKEMPSPLPGPKPTLFFAPDAAQARTKAWGPDGFAARLGTAWQGFRPRMARWMTIDTRAGADALAPAWAQAVAGQLAADTGVILRISG